MKIKLGEKEYDLGLALPLTLGDLRRLKKEHNTTLSDLQTMDVEVIIKVLLLIFRKLDPEVTEDLVDTVPVHQLSAIATFLSEAAIPDRPTLG